MEIVIPKLEDASGLAEVHVRTWKKAYKDLISLNYLNSLSVLERTESWENTIVNNISDIILFAAKDRQKVVGFICAGRCTEESYGADLEIFGFYVLPEYQKTGIGKKLFYKLIEEMKSKSYSSVCLWCLSKSFSVGFYKNLGGIYQKSKNIEIPLESNDYYSEDLYLFNNLDSINDYS